MATHDLILAGGVVIKRFQFRRRDEHRREWVALQLLDRRAPGLAPRPISCDLDGEPPTVTMSRLRGEPLGTTPLTSEQVTALAAALDRLHQAVPAADAEALPPATGHPFHGLASTRRLLDTHPGVRDEPTITEALVAARRWLHSADAERTTDLDAAPSVFGREDHNLPNFLAHNDRMLLVDFEDSGRSDRSTELATMIEHQAARCTADATWEPLLAAGDRRLRDARRYYAAWWLAVMLPGQRGHHRNSPEARRTQARRTLTLLT